MSDFLISKPIDVATRETATFLSSYLANGSEIIEVGCGDGEVAAQLLRQGYRVIGLDSEKDRVAKAQALGVDAVVASWPQFNYQPVDCLHAIIASHQSVGSGGNKGVSPTEFGWPSTY